MKRVCTLAALLLIVGLLVGCQAAPAVPAGGDSGAAAPASASGAPVLIGYTASVTGKLNVESTRQTNGLNLWIKQVNDAGGLKLPDGTVLTFDTKFYDDESNNDRIQELYTKLATDDGAAFLISPYSSGLTASASVIAEQYGKVMITTGAASDSNYEQGYTLVYQAYTPASKYLTGAIDMLKAKAPDAKKLAIVHENDKFSTDVSTAAQELCRGKWLRNRALRRVRLRHDRFCALHQQDPGSCPRCDSGRRPFPGRQHLCPPVGRKECDDALRRAVGGPARTQVRGVGRRSPGYHRPQPVGAPGGLQQRGRRRGWRALVWPVGAGIHRRVHCSLRRGAFLPCGRRLCGWADPAGGHRARRFHRQRQGAGGAGCHRPPDLLRSHQVRRHA